MGNRLVSRLKQLTLSEDADGQESKTPVTANELRTGKLVVNASGSILGRKKVARKPLRTRALKKLGSGRKGRRVSDTQSLTSDDTWVDIDEVEQGSSPPTLVVRLSAKHRKPGQRKGFSDFPVELRDMIYTYAMTDMPTRVELSNHTKLSQWAFQPQTLPNVCFVSKKLREESILA
jgi:hypothetical protein